jgi:hypothetical protein
MDGWKKLIEAANQTSLVMAQNGSDGGCTA